MDRRRVLLTSHAVLAGRPRSRVSTSACNMP